MLQFILRQPFVRPYRHVGVLLFHSPGSSTFVGAAFEQRVFC